MLTLFSDTSLGIVIRFIPPPPWWHHHPYHHYRSLLSLLLSASLEGTLAVDRGRPANRGFQHRGQLHNKPACHQRRHRHGERPRGLKAAGFYGLKAAGFRGWKRVKNPGMISSGVGNSRDLLSEAQTCQTLESLDASQQIQWMIKRPHESNPLSRARRSYSVHGTNGRSERENNDAIHGSSLCCVNTNYITSERSALIKVLRNPPKPTQIIHFYDWIHIMLINNDQHMFGVALLAYFRNIRETWPSLPTQQQPWYLNNRV